MIKKYFSLLLFIIFSSSSFSQGTEIISEISETQKKGQLSGVIGVVGEDDGGYFVLRSKTKGLIAILSPVALSEKLILDYYDKEMSLISTIEMGDIRLKRGANPDKCYEFFAQDEDNNLYLFHSEKIDDHTILYKSRLEKSSLKFDQPELISKLRNEQSRGRQGTFYLIYSQNKLKTAVVSMSKADNKDQSNLSLVFFDESMNKKYSSEEVLRFSQREIGSTQRDGSVRTLSNSVSNIRLSNNGDLLILANTILDRKFFKGTFYDFHLISISQNNTEVIYKKIDFDGKIPLSAGLTVLNESSDEIRCTGFYSSEKEYSIEGIFAIDFKTESLTPTNENFKKFDQKQKEDFLVSENRTNEKIKRSDRRIKKKLAKNKDVDIHSFFIREQFAFDDQSYTIVAESFYITTSQNFGPNGQVTSTVTYYNYMDLVFIHINNNGKIEWVKNVNKVQVSTTPVILGVFFFQNGDHINGVYNDFTGKRLVAVSVDKESEVQYKTLGFRTRKGLLYKYFATPSNFRRVNENEVIGFVNRKKKGKMVKIKF